jgi:ABC-2 type transport system permease protein
MCGSRVNARGRTSSRAKPLRDFAWLLWSELFVLREQWFWYVVQASFVPVSYLFFLWLLVGREDPRRMAFFVTGSLVMSLSFGGLISLGQHLGSLKAYHAFDYYAALPISKAAFVAAIATRGMLLALPSTLVVLALGHAVFGLPVPALGLAVLLLSAYAMAGFGAVIGFWSPSAQVASLATQVLQTIIIFFGPIYYPLESLPQPLQWIARLWPTTYAAEAVRGAMGGVPAEQLWLPIAALTGFVGLSLVLVPMKLEWRTR